MAEEETTEETVTPKKKRKASHAKEVNQLAEQVLDGDWGSGRERDEELRAAGHDPTEVRLAAERIRGERIREAEQPRNRLLGRRGS